MDQTNEKSRTQQDETIEKQHKESSKEACQFSPQDYYNLLLNEKDNLGYKDCAWEQFLALIPDEYSDTITQSAFITLQDKYRTYLKQKRLSRTPQEVVAEFNKTYAVISLDQTYILREKKNALGLPDFSLESRASFKSFHEEDRIIDEKGKEHYVADIWLKSPDRRKYHGIVFDPAKIGSDEGFYNLWKGFNEQPVPGITKKYWTHVHDIICNGNKEAYEYVRKWLAKVFQHPNEVHTALVLCGSQGVGKDTFVRPLGALLGTHYAPLNNIHQLVGNFNGHLKHAVLIHANESFWGGLKKEVGVLKSMITESLRFIESKGKDQIVIKSCWHIIFSSNEDWAIYMDFDDRRFFVLKVSEKQKGNQLYFKELNDELERGGHAALLHDLLHEDITNFNPRIIPSSPHAFGIKLRSTESPERYLHEALFIGSFSLSTEGDTTPVWQGQIPKQDVYKDYRTWCSLSDERPLSKELFGRALKKILPSIKDTRPAGSKRIWCYSFKSLEETRKEFCLSFKEDIKRIFYADIEHTNVHDDTPIVQATIAEGEST